MTDATRPLVRHLTEEELLARIFPLLPMGPATLLGPGDDAAVVAAPDGRFVVTTDVLVEDRHFRRRWSAGDDVGARAATANLADVAAMGARPTSLVVSLVVPGDLPVDWVTGLARGLADVCGPVGAGVVGGDLSGGDAVVVAVTAHGDLEGREPVTRSGARPGDVLAYAGHRGLSAAGLALLDAGLVGPEDATSADPGADDVSGGVGACVAGYLRPEAPLAAGPEAARSGTTAMLDVSDGLLRDAGRLARASGVGVDIERDALAGDVDRLLPAARALGVGREAALAWALTGGEDHGLLAAFPSDVVLPEGFRRVGRVLPGPAGVTVDGQEPAVRGGWDHFAG
ncbi:thiamine-phosphate kinase [Krasilnikoviella flava]|uniref:Thiamine-monophosphate kinase n=1 Tax=Krasilnikoviella flava TaxID=526729 RepID=A0A1T5KT94_9MICO|nr:thiamine-phosphate kinase [Krasilnikoviella flava]SKC67004.1 thiamine-monophosphate kinase [Krasilnikoviella flava]